MKCPQGKIEAAQLNTEPLGGLYVLVSEAALNDIYKPKDALNFSSTLYKI